MNSRRRPAWTNQGRKHSEIPVDEALERANQGAEAGIYAEHGVKVQDPAILPLLEGMDREYENLRENDTAFDGASQGWRAKLKRGIAMSVAPPDEGESPKTKKAEIDMLDQ